MQARPAAPEGAAAIARTHNDGIERRIATFETRARAAEEIRSRFGGRHPVVVVEDGGYVVGVAEFPVYADRAGFWKLVSRGFVENAPSRRLLRPTGFREVATRGTSASMAPGETR